MAKPRLAQRGIPGLPEATRAGTPLAGGRRAILCAVTGDLAWFCEFLYAPKSTSLKPCVLCRAESRGENTWHDQRDLAKWRATNWTSDCWFAWESRSQRALFSDPQRFVSGLFVHYGLMHCKYLGWEQHLYEGIFYVLTHNQMTSEEPLANLHTLARFIRSHQKDHKVHTRYQQTLGKLSMLVKK